MSQLLSKITFISAGAGSGKTTALSSELAKRLAEARFDPKSVAAVTFSRHAAGELVERVRQRLIEEGKPELAHAMDSAKIGTIHSVCARILREYCYEEGVGPTQGVLAEEQATSLFRSAVSSREDDAIWSTIYSCAGSLGVEAARISGDVERLASLARENGLSADGIRQSLPESEKELSLVLGKTTSDDLLAALLPHLEAFVRDLPDPQGQPNDTVAGHETARRMIARIQERGTGVAALSWGEWLSLSKFKLGADHREYAEAIQGAAGRYVESPEFQQIALRLLRAVHEAAALGMQRYADAKRRLGMIDYLDMEQKLLALLDRPDVQARVAEEVRLLFVDECQDTSPIQLAIFMKLARHCVETVWVGDPKQSIYGFRGADLELSQEVIRQVPASQLKVLDRNFRSRKAIVDFTSELFAAAFAKDGLPREQVVLTADQDRPSGLSAIQLWDPPGGRSVLEKATRIAARVVEILGRGHLITDRHSGLERPLRASDIAILCRKNSHFAAFRSAFARHGVGVTCKLGSISDLPEVAVALAAYRYAVDAHDRVAAAELALHLGGDRAKWMAGVMAGHPTDDWHPVLSGLTALRLRARELSPSELLDVAIDLSGLKDHLMGVVQGEERASTLGLLGIAAREYEEICVQSGQPSTHVGLLAHLASQTPSGESETLSGSVRLMTYHGSKGLEWPMVVLFGLMDKSRRNLIFSPRVVASEQTTLEEPLRGRSVRYLPFLFGRSNSKPPPILEARISGLDSERKLLAAQESGDRRLLYVGMTRARDSLVLLGKRDATLAERFFGAVTGAATTPSNTERLGFPRGQGTELKIGAKTFECSRLTCPEVDLPEQDLTERRLILPVPRSRVPSDKSHRARQAPSSLSEVPGALSAGEIQVIGKYFSVPSGIDGVTLGDCIHVFLGSDDPGLDRSFRLSHAQGVLDRWSMSQALKPEDLVEMSDRLSGFSSRLFQGGRIHRELPMAFLSGVTEISGIMDYLIVGEREIAIVDHKSSYLHNEQVDSLITRYSGQLLAYRQAVLASDWAKGRTVSLWLHLPVAAKMVRVIPGP